MNESSPGSNGLTINFFKKFFPLFGEDFVEILNDEINILPETFNETIIKLIIKNDNKIKNVIDLRPIPLTNFEYRIFTKILVNRFKIIGPHLFLDYQTCSVGGRRINDSINAIKDLIEDANQRKNELYLVSIDQRKAFDSMSHEYLFALLDHLDIDMFLNKLIKRIYSKSTAKIVMDRYTTHETILVKSGIKQGCALSMFLYTVGIEELAVNIHYNMNIIGYSIPRVMSNIRPINEMNEIKMTIYADDTGGSLC